MHFHRPGKIQPIVIAFLIPAVVIVAAVLFVVLRKASLNRQQPFPVAAYFAAPDNLKGNRYGLDAQVEQRLAWDEGFGKLLVLKPVDGERRLSVFVPDRLVSSNLELGQRFHLVVIVRSDGVIAAEELDKY